MGYYTRFNLKLIRQPDKTDEQIIAELRDQSEEADFCLMEDGSDADDGKWYEHEEQLKEFSKLYPEILFILEGKGEENEDMWIKYFKNGKVQIAKAKLAFEPFDPNKLA